MIRATIARRNARFWAPASIGGSVLTRRRVRTEPPMDAGAQKRALRRAMVARIMAMDPERRREQEAALADRLAALPGFAEAETVLLYVTALPEEVATGP